MYKYSTRQLIGKHSMPVQVYNGAWHAAWIFIRVSASSLYHDNDKALHGMITVNQDLNSKDATERMQ